MRLTVLGGGGFRVPLVYRALLQDGRRAGGGLVHEVVLYDTAPARLPVVAAVLAAVADSAPAGVRPPEVRLAAELDDALRGADAVFCAMRVGGTAGRVSDERVALAAGVLGQETVGPGGVAYALRTVPVAVEVARRVAEHAPDAWVVNFTNPAGLVTEAMRAVLGGRVLGICDSPLGLARGAARALGLDPAATRPDYVGLNHLGWLRALHDADGRDRLPELLGDPARLAAVEEGRLFGARWLRALGALPNEYLYYYYRAPEALAAVRAAAETRGEYLRTQQERFYAAAAGAPPAAALAAWESARRDREETYLSESRLDGGRRAGVDLAGGGYQEVAVVLLRALAGGGDGRLILNVANAGTLPQLPADAVVEVPCAVGPAGASPLPAGPLDSHQLGLVSAVKSVERAVIAAAATGSREAALRAFAFHPLVGSSALAERLLDGYLAADPALADLLGNP